MERDLSNRNKALIRSGYQPLRQGGFGTSEAVAPLSKEQLIKLGNELNKTTWSKNLVNLNS